MHPRISINSLCFGSQPLISAVTQCRAMGAARISLLGSQLSDDLIREIKRGELAIETVAHVLEAGILEVASKTGAQARLTRAIEAAASSGANSVYLLTGARGALDWEAAADLFCEIIAPCVTHARKASVRLLVENAPFLYSDFHFVHSLRDAIALARVAGIGLCVDVYGCWTEADLSSLLHEAAPLAGIVQLSDHVPGDRALPARAVPGDGAIPIRAIVQTLLASGYDGAFDLELLGPRIDQEGSADAVQRAAKYVDEMLNSLGA